MDLTAWTSRLLHLFVRRPPARQRVVDAADMGTAFGLEASLLDFDPSECDGQPGSIGPLFQSSVLRSPR
jgi:hypothetical protein